MKVGMDKLYDNMDIVCSKFHFKMNDVKAAIAHAQPILLRHHMMYCTVPQ